MPIIPGQQWSRKTFPDRWELDNGQGHVIIVHRHITHFHAEYIMPWTDDGGDRQKPEDIKTYYERLVVEGFQGVIVDAV